MGLKADIVKALRVSLNKEDSEYLAKEIMDRLPPVYAAAPEMLKCLKDVAKRGVIPGYGSADALAIRIVGTQSIAREAITKAKGDTQ